MQLLVIRHAIAEDREVFARTGQPDDLRPLTADGRKKMRRGAPGIARLVPKLDILASSPFSRALETAALVARAYAANGHKINITELPQLKQGGSPADLMRWVARQNPEAIIAIVGHEPDLGAFISRSLSSEPRSFVTFKKGAAVLLDFPSRPREGRAKLLWCLTPRQLRLLGP